MYSPPLPLSLWSAKDKKKENEMKRKRKKKCMYSNCPYWSLYLCLCMQSVRMKSIWQIAECALMLSSWQKDTFFIRLSCQAPIFRSVTCTGSMYSEKCDYLVQKKVSLAVMSLLVTGCGVAQFVNENLLIVSTLASAVSFCNSPGSIQVHKWLLKARK
jgi:hypothetical protein